jgi:hypothetical protein
MRKRTDVAGLSAYPLDYVLNPWLQPSRVRQVQRRTTGVTVEHDVVELAVLQYLSKGAATRLCTLVKTPLHFSHALAPSPCVGSQSSFQYLPGR